VRRRGVVIDRRLEKMVGDIIQRRVRAQMMSAAAASGILRHADDNAAKVLTDLLTRDGYTVAIRRPPVQRMR